MKPILAFIGGILLVLTYSTLTHQDPELFGARKPANLEEKMQALYEKYGGFVQLTSDGRLLYKNNVISEAELLNFVPPNTTIDVYEGPCGVGYQVIRKTPTSTISTGFGCEGPSRTYTQPIVTSSATST